MSTQRDFDRIAAAWLAEGPSELADRVLGDALAEVHLTHQRRFRAPWRNAQMSFFSSAIGRAAAAAIAVVVVLAGALYLIGNRPAVGDASASPPVSVAPPSAGSLTPTTAATHAPISTPSQPSTAGWTAFSSTRYGYDLRLPTGWTGVQSSRQWTMAADQTDFWKTTAADQFNGPDPLIPANTDIFTVFAIDLPAATTLDQWISSYFGPDGLGSPSPCLRRMDGYPPFTVSGHVSVLWTEPHTATDCGGTYAFLLVGGRVYSFTMGAPGEEQLLGELLSTVQFRT